MCDLDHVFLFIIVIYFLPHECLFVY
jgi:hypothetical protein